MAVTTLVSCTDDNNGGLVDPVNDYKAIITNLADNVYTATYKNLDEQATVLKTKLDALQIKQNATTLKEARDAWRATRQPWESSEGFLFGPAGDIGTGALSLDGELDDWPVDIIELEPFLKGTAAITKKTVGARKTTEKGFHGIEYLLWGSTGVKTHTEFTSRELEYLTFLATDLKNNTKALYVGWTSGGFAAIFKAAGTTAGREWTSQKAALQAATSVGLDGNKGKSGMYNIADEVSTSKIAAVFGSAKEEESRFSHNSKTDFMNNMRSIQNVYLGTYGTASNGQGIGTIISLENPTLHTQFITEVTTAINAIDAIKGIFTEAIVNDKTGIQNAINKVNIVSKTLIEEIAPIIANLITL